MSPLRHAASAVRSPGRSRFFPESPWSTWIRAESTPMATSASRCAVRSCWSVLQRAYATRTWLIPPLSHMSYPHREEHRAGLTGTRRPGLTPPPAARCVVPFRILSNRRLRTRDKGALSGPLVVLVLLATAYCLLLRTAYYCRQPTTK